MMRASAQVLAQSGADLSKGPLFFRGRSRSRLAADPRHGAFERLRPGAGLRLTLEWLTRK